MSWAVPAVVSRPFTQRRITGPEVETFQGNAAPLNAGTKAVTTLSPLQQADCVTIYIKNTTDQAVTFRFFTGPAGDTSDPYQLPDGSTSFVLAAGNVTPQRDFVSLLVEAHLNVWCEATPAGATTVGAVTASLVTSTQLRSEAP